MTHSTLNGSRIMKREGLNVELNRGKLWIYPCWAIGVLLLTIPTHKIEKQIEVGEKLKQTLKLIL